MFMEEYENINFLVGVNGSGKSRYLNKVAKKYNNYQYNVLAISNTVFDKIDSKYCKKISANRGRYMLKQTFLESLLNDGKSVGAFDILDYLGFKREVKILFKFPKVINKDNLYNYLHEELGIRKHTVKKKHSVISEYEIDEIFSIFIDQMDVGKNGQFYLRLDDFDARNKTKSNYFIERLFGFNIPKHVMKIDIAGFKF